MEVKQRSDQVFPVKLRVTRTPDLFHAMVAWETQARRCALFEVCYQHAATSFQTPYRLKITASRCR